MRILQVIPYFVPAWDYGGPVQVAHKLSENLVKRGHQVAVYTTDALNSSGRNVVPLEIIDGIKVRRFRNFSNFLAYKHKIFLSAGMISSLAGEIENYDIIHMHEYRTIQNVIAHHYAVKHHIPYVIQAHGSIPRFTVKKGLKLFFDNLWGYKILRDAARILVLTETEAAQYNEMGIDKNSIAIVPNGIELADFKELPAKGEFRKKLGLKNDREIILFLGRIHRIKGLELLIQAFAGLQNKRSNADLVIVGPDEGYRAEMEKLVRELGIQGKVFFTGPLYKTDKLQAYVDASVYVLPSVYDTFPVGVVEACACGLPVIVTDGCGIAGIINGKAGLSVPREVEKLTEALSQVLSDEKMRQEFGNNGKRLVNEKFNWDVITGQVEELYKNCL